MALLVPNASETRMLENIVGKTTPQNLVVRLYTNNLHPAEGHVAADYTEASGSGYTAQACTPGDWTTTPDSPSVIVHPQLVFGFTGALGNVYGYFVTEATSGLLKWAERFPSAPYDVQNNGDEIKVTPRLTLE